LKRGSPALWHNPWGTVPGDVTGDGVVDIYDAITIAGHYNSVAGSPKYDVRCDLNLDGNVDIYDAILCSNYNGASVHKQDYLCWIWKSAEVYGIAWARLVTARTSSGVSFKASVTITLFKGAPTFVNCTFAIGTEASNIYLSTDDQFSQYYWCGYGTFYDNYHVQWRGEAYWCYVANPATLDHAYRFVVFGTLTASSSSTHTGLYFTTSDDTYFVSYVVNY
jgi:hypothetical protein